MVKYVVISLLVAAPLSIAAAASPVDNYAQQKIVLSQYANAARALEAQTHADPFDESALLNLAYVYRRTGREAEAVRLYRRVLQLENAELNTTSGKPSWSHDVARAALAAPSTTITMR